ncbi:MAG: hypothetical protein LBR74_01785 [Eubacterium sp.]|nr:hypothetical protein [Eubacterium sp.]
MVKLVNAFDILKETIGEKNVMPPPYSMINHIVFAGNYEGQAEIACQLKTYLFYDLLININYIFKEILLHRGTVK